MCHMFCFRVHPRSKHFYTGSHTLCAICSASEYTREVSTSTLVTHTMWQCSASEFTREVGTSTLVTHTMWQCSASEFTREVGTSTLDRKLRTAKFPLHDRPVQYLCINLECLIPLCMVVATLWETCNVTINWNCDRVNKRNEHPIANLCSILCCWNGF